VGIESAISGWEKQNSARKIIWVSDRRERRGDAIAGADYKKSAIGQKQCSDGGFRQLGDRE
jgi:hypothetical protein